MDRQQPEGFLAQIGKGRPKGAVNKSTATMKEAIQSVYNSLQEGHAKPHGHFLQWAENNETEFYKLASKLIPVQNEISGADGAPLGIAVVFQKADGE